MRIGIEAQRIFRSKKHGMDIYALELIRQLQRTDLENEYFIFVKSGPDHCLQETPNFKIIEVKGATYADWEQIWLPLSVNKHKIDLLHCTSNTAPILTRTTLLVTLHDIIYLNKSFSGGSLYQRLGHYYRKWIVPSVFKKAKKVFTVSEFEKKHIIEKLGDEHKVQSIYNGVGKKFRPYSTVEQDAIKSKLNLPDDYFFFLGNTAPKKNMIGFLKAYKLYTEEIEIPFPVVIAESSKEDLQKMLTEINGLSLMKYIHLTGYVQHAELPEIYASAHCFVYPSLRESFGIPIIEAMACGTYVITSNTSSMPEVASDAAILVDPYNVVEIKLAMITSQFSLEKEEVIQAGLNRAAQFSWENTAAQVSANY
jgi:glycosyltransferase involved in cell wall biosynthesis